MATATAGLVSRAWGVIQRSALRAGFRHDGQYRPLERLDIVFAGDTFDLYASRLWATGDDRPWHRSTSAETARREVAASALRRSAMLNRFARRLLNEGLVVPSATRQGRPHLRHPTAVPVSVTLLSGDRDGSLEPPQDWPQGVHWAHSWSAGNGRSNTASGLTHSRTSRAAATTDPLSFSRCTLG